MTDRHTVPMFPALALMEKHLRPTRYGHSAYLRAPITPPSETAYIPSWNWHSILEVPEGRTRLTLDANGAYLSALGSVRVGHSHLTHRGAPEGTPAPREVDPGYYLISVPYWAFSGTIVSPLGDSARLETQDRLWVAHPTLILLLELEEMGALGRLEILDSWTAQARCDFRPWVDRMKEVRADLLAHLAHAHPGGDREDCDCHDCATYAAFKEGYSAALSMMLTGEKCATRRPDWTHAVYAQHAATMWRKAWRYTETGYPLMAMGHVDELTILAEDLAEALDRPKPPFRFDPTGHRLGALKPKPEADRRHETQEAAAVPLVDDGADIL